MCKMKESLPFLMLSQRALLGFLTALLLILSFCSCDKEPVEVAGMVECVDCTRHNIEPSHAFSGLHVAIICKFGNGRFRTAGVGELTQEGKFKVSFPSEMVKEDGVSNVELMKKCFPQLLRNATGEPCHNPNNGKDKFGPAGKLLFSPITVTSATHFKLPKRKILLGIAHHEPNSGNSPVSHPPRHGPKPYNPKPPRHPPPRPPH